MPTVLFASEVNQTVFESFSLNPFAVYYDKHSSTQYEQGWHGLWLRGGYTSFGWLITWVNKKILVTLLTCASLPTLSLLLFNGEERRGASVVLHLIDGLEDLGHEVIKGDKVTNETMPLSAQCQYMDFFRAQPVFFCKRCHNAQLRKWWWLWYSSLLESSTWENILTLLCNSSCSSAGYL